jgi:hypothetical protein
MESAMIRLLFTLAILAVAGPALAQHQHAPQHQPSGYAGMTARPIKALSDEQIEQLREGRGMGLSLPAELNRYPGPLHVLELAAPLGLDETQRRQVTAIQATMSREAKALGEAVIAAEARLDRMFAEGRAEADAAMALLHEIAALNGRLRIVHILAHLQTRALLSPAQVARYDAERGYGTR